MLGNYTGRLESTEGKQRERHTEREGEQLRVDSRQGCRLVKSKSKMLYKVRSLKKKKYWTRWRPRFTGYNDISAKDVQD